MSVISHDRNSGCGLFNMVFGHRKRSKSKGSLQKHSHNRVTRIPSTPAPKNRKDNFNGAFSDSYNVRNGRTQDTKHEKHRGSSNMSMLPRSQEQGYDNHTRKVPQGTLGISGELDSMITDYEKSFASSSNIMVFGNLGNVRSNGCNGNPASVLDQVSKREEKSFQGKYSTSVMGNVLKIKDKPVSLCRVLSTRMDPEKLKILGNEDYKNGKFTEALALYDAAISIDPSKASYRSNRSAALTALGRLIEAAFECREAILIDPFYQRAHNRLGTLYVRLGEAEKAMYHFKQAGSEADPDAMNKAKNIQFHLNKCTEAKRHGDWNTVLKEIGISISSGADYAPLVLGLKAEALVKLKRHKESIEIVENGPKIDIDDCTKLFGPISSANLLLSRAQVDIVAGRFDDALASAQRASRLDPNNKEASPLLRKVRAVSNARSNGNELFKAAKFNEACIAYSEGLNHDPYNTVLLCNRAACRAKLGQYVKAIEDCNAALNLRPDYYKARLRRADLYAKVENWRACIEDCEMLLRQNSNDGEAGKMLKGAKGKLNEGSKDVEMVSSSVHANGLVDVSSNERFRDYVTSPGVSVVLFCNKACNRTVAQIVEGLYQRYPSVNFLKVEVEDHPDLVRSEGIKVNALPIFVIYTNGSRAREISGDKLYGSLENSIRYYISF